MIPETHKLWRAAKDLKIGPTESVILVTEAPRRWDELLDTQLPILIDNSVGSWDLVCAGLWEAGCPLDVPARSVEAHGRVRPLNWEQNVLSPKPEGPEWSLALRWTHPSEGWRARLPLWGQHFVVTRAEQQAAELVGRLRDLGATATAAPTITFREPDDPKLIKEALESLSSFHWVLFTSPNGVEFFMEFLKSSCQDLRALGGARLGTIGPSTAKSLATYGLKADLVPSEFVAEGLLEALTQQHPMRGQRILLPRAQVARTVLPDRLRELGADVLVAPVYKTITPDSVSLPSLADAELIPILLFTSSSTVENWTEAHPECRWPCYCIGPITAATAQNRGLKVLGVAAEYTVDGLVERLLADGHQ